MTQTPNSTPQPIPGLGAVILCGGQSSRMGTNKAHLEFEGKTLLEHVVSRVSIVASPIVLAGSVDPGFDLPPNVLIADDEIPGQGPLEGIRVGLRRLHLSNVELGFVTGCDVPLLEPDFVKRLHELVGSHQAAVPIDGQRIYGISAIYRTDLADTIESQIQSGQLAVKSLSQRVDSCLINVDRFRDVDPQLNSLMNINRRDDYQKLLNLKTEMG